MNQHHQHITELLEKLATQKASAAELDQLYTLLKEGDYDDTVVNIIQSQLESFDSGDKEEIDFWKSRLSNIPQTITKGGKDEYNEEDANATPVHRVRFLRRSWLRYAAAVVAVIAIGAYFWLRQGSKQTGIEVEQPLAADIKPGREGAILTLADGSRMLLDSLKNGVIAEQSGSTVSLKDGKMSYTPDGKTATGIVYNTMSTPRGRQFQLTLPDGTHVWLNAESSIKYPTVFSGNMRRVEVKGELYFDVAKDASKPFIVDTDIMSVEVVGTEFNINCYDNETYAQTTLVEGLVKLVSNADQEEGASSAPRAKLLHPGKQASISRKAGGSDPISISDAENIDQVIAWKDGLFNFNKVDLFNLMRQLERWYDIKVVYKGKVENVKFRGRMYRNVNLSDVIKELRKMDLSIEQQGNTLILSSSK